MGFVGFVGRVLFASVFLVSAYQEASQFGTDGGPAAKIFEPKYNHFVKQVSSVTGMAVPHFEINNILYATIYLRAFGAGFFILYSSVGASLLLMYLAFISPVMYDFYNYENTSPEGVLLHDQFVQNMALYGAILFFVGMKSSIEDSESSIPERLSKRKKKRAKTRKYPVEPVSQRG